MSPKPMFGGHKMPKIPWHPLAHMEEYVAEVNKRDITPVAKSMRYLALAHFGVFCRKEDIRHPAEIERKHILHFQTYLQQEVRSQVNGKPISSSYQVQLMRGLRVWLTWLVDRRYLIEDPWVNIKVREPPKIKRPIAHDDIAQLFDTHRRQAFSVSPFFFHRREAMLTLLYGWGLGLGEMVALNVPNMDMREDFVVVRSGTGIRHMPYTPEMKAVISRWLTLRSTKAMATEDALLIDNSGWRMTVASARKIVQDLGDRAGVKIQPSRLRDTFGHNLLDQGVDLEVVMSLLGLVDKQGARSYDPKVIEARKAIEEQITPELTKLLGRNEIAEVTYHAHDQED